MSAREHRSNRKDIPSSSLSFTPHRHPLHHSLVFIRSWPCSPDDDTDTSSWAKIRIQSAKKCLAWGSNRMRQSLTSCLRKVLGYEIEIYEENEHSERVRDACGLITLRVPRRSSDPSQTFNVLGLLVGWRYVVSGQNHVVRVPLMVAHCWKEVTLRIEESRVKRREKSLQLDTRLKGRESKKVYPTWNTYHKRKILKGSNEHSSSGQEDEEALTTTVMVGELIQICIWAVKSGARARVDWFVR